MKVKAATENDCHAELERICRLIAYHKQDGNSLYDTRKALQVTLEKLAAIRSNKQEQI